MQQASRVGCQRCPALCQSRKSIVDGAGRLDSLLLVVGDMPRREDDRSGNPFVGQDGQLLRSTISEACVRLGVDGSRVYYTNSIRCRPSYQRVPEQEELDNCLGWLVDEIETVRPVCILAVGAIAQDQVGEAVGAAVGYAFPLPIVKRAYHPAFILKNRTKLANWTQQVEEAVRRAFSVPEVAATVPSSGDWLWGTPAPAHPFLSADTEFDNLEEYGSEMVGWSVSDGVSAEFRTDKPLKFKHLYCHNIKADAQHLGIDLDDLDSWDDTMLMAYVTRRFPRVGLKVLGPLLAGVEW